MPSGDIWTNFSWMRLRQVAIRAATDPKFRGDAKNPANTQQTIESDATLQAALDAAGLGRLDEEEIAFCIGWIKLSVFECQTDADLVNAIQNELSGPPAG